MRTSKGRRYKFVHKGRAELIPARTTEAPYDDDDDDEEEEEEEDKMNMKMKMMMMMMLIMNLGMYR